MTISSEVRKAGPYTGNGATKSFPFSFKVFAASDMVVVRTDLTGAETTLTLTTDYTISLNANQDANPGGTINMLTAPPSGYLLTATSGLRDLQPATLTNMGGFYPKVINDALDRVTILIQQLSEKVSRSVKNAISAPAGINPTLPAPVPYSLIGWNSSGTGFQNTDPTYSTALATDLAGSADGKGGALVAFLQSGIGAAARTVQDKLRETASVKDFGAKGDGSTNDNAAINAAVAALNAGTFGRLYFPAGTYVVSTSFTITANMASIVGDGARTSVIQQTTNVDTLIFTSTNPTSGSPSIGHINDITMRDIGIDYGAVAAPTAGKAVTLVRPSRCRFTNVHISSVFNGMDISGGGGDNFFSNLSISGAYSWTGMANGSWLLRFTKYANGINEVPSEYFFENFNIKGSVTPNYLQNAIIIQCGDGLWFSNGHCGFTDNYDLWINAQNDASAPISDIKFDHVYFDGNFGGSTTGAGIAINGSDTPTMEQITFIGCVSKIHNGHGVNQTRGVVGLMFDGCQISYNGAYGAILHGTAARYNDGLIFKGNYIAQNNANNSGADAFTCSYTTSGQVSGNIVKGVPAKPHPNGFNFGAATSNMVVADNITKNCTTDYTALTTSTGMTVARNRKADSEPTIVCSDGMVVPLGFDVVVVTGNTNFSNIGGTLVPNRVVTLRFTGTPTCFDSAGNIKLVGNFVATADSTLTLLCTGSVWTEVARAVV